MEGTLELQMRIQEEFYSSYLDSNTPEHTKLARNVTEEVSFVFKMKHPSTFLNCTVNHFWNGSIGVDMTLTFMNQTVVPSNYTAVSDLTEAIQTGKIALNIVKTSISMWVTNSTANSE